MGSAAARRCGAAGIRPGPGAGDARWRSAAGPGPPCAGRRRALWSPRWGWGESWSLPPNESSSLGAGDQDGPQRIRHDWPDPLHGRKKARAHASCHPVPMVPVHCHPARRRTRKSLVLPGQAHSTLISCSARSRPGCRLHPRGRQIRTGVRCFSQRRLLYFAAVPGPGFLRSGFRIMLLTCVELWGFEPQTSCMPCRGNTSTAVHLCRSPSQDVRISPLESRPVAVLSRCTDRPAQYNGRFAS